MSSPRARLAATGLCVGALFGSLVVDLNLPSLVSFIGDRSYFMPICAALGALVWPTPLRRLLAAGVVLLSACWLVVCFTPLTRRMADGLVRRDAVQDADVVFVFATWVQEDGDPSTDAMSRLLKGLELVAGRRAPLLVVSEVRPPAGSYAVLARSWVATFGAPAEVLSFGPVVNTHDEAVALAKLCRERGIRRVLAVTSPTHTRRAAATLEKQGLAVIAVPARETNFDLEELKRPGDRRRAFGVIAHELLGLAVYKRRGWI